MQVATIEFPKFTGTRCLMMPYIQGDATSLPYAYSSYAELLNNVFIEKGSIGFLTIDESPVEAGKPHRSARSKTERAIHTEAGRIPGVSYVWGGGGWGGKHTVLLERDVRVLLANNIDDSCALWDATHEDTSEDGDLGHVSSMYPYSDATLMKAGEVHSVGILTPHESLPVKQSTNRQFLRILSKGVHGREPYFTTNPLICDSYIDHLTT
jgi:hypothetical protein